MQCWQVAAGAAAHTHTHTRGGVGEDRGCGQLLGCTPRKTSHRTSDKGSSQQHISRGCFSFVSSITFEGQ